MRTKNFFMSLATCALVLGGLASCATDEPNVGPESGVDSGEGVFMSLTVKLPEGGTRSQTVTPGQSNDGTEVGTKEENTVSNVLIVVAKAADNSFIVAGQVQKDGLTPISAANSYKTVVKMQKTNLNDYYKSDKFSRNVNIFVFCNPTTNLLDAVKTWGLNNTNWYNEVCTVIEGGNDPNKNTGIWADNGFLMSNVTLDTRTLPATINDWDAYKTANTAFDFSGVNQAGQNTEVDNSATNGRGPVKVLRAVARFDFRDGSQDAADPAPEDQPNTYNVVKNSEGKTLVQVELTRMSMANMSKTFYYLPRVSDNGEPDGANFQLCGPETPTNYLVGPNWQAFDQEVTSGFETYFNYPLFTNNGQDYNRNGWYTSNIANVLNNRGDNYEGPDANGAAHTRGTYKFWRYVTPNLIPGEPVNQRNGVTTGVIFEGRMMATKECNGSSDKYLQAMYDWTHGVNGKKLTGKAEDDPILYSFNGSLYFSWNNVVEAAIAASVTFEGETDAEGKPTGKVIITNVNRSEPLYVAVFGNGGMGHFTYGDREYDDPDNLTVDTSSANYVWGLWDKAGRPGGGSLETNMRAAIVGQGFTIYQSSVVNGVAGYYCYYFYWNRHNDNLQNGVMGPMEFSVVRNNVYKLAVTGIKQLGHPRLPSNDPDSPTPGTPDESDDIYLTVTCDVVPWVVRINNIEF